jgi:hypothetical protein
VLVPQIPIGLLELFEATPEPPDAGERRERHH